MISLRYQFNACMATLEEGKEPRFNVVPVKLKNGDYRRVKWLGYIDLCDAQNLANAKPVKLLVASYSVSVSPYPKWIHLKDGEAIQGCLTVNGVYCIAEGGSPKVI
ncbi:hypothetical protein AZF00_00805 [Zhongshania aliphaticivorans]|uniref:Uncharacterized protein n=1 Tax=Zhongshania aliphaticivorans TaxID=1470434 RepID=A0A127M127_9GAMM|nr:hypothetical protein AZF00_00805 [Zhongshania aliphaticivorans]